jgi:hypothetical protein
VRLVITITRNVAQPCQVTAKLDRTGHSTIGGDALDDGGRNIGL